MLTACAGPMSPFGAINGLPKLVSMGDGKVQPWNGRDTRVSFYPSHQVLHGPTSFSIIVEDPEGVPKDHWMQLSYNGLDVTHGFLARAERTYLDSSRRRLRLTVPHVRLSALSENRVKATYQREAQSKPVWSYYEPPSCSAFEASRALASVPEFEPPSLMVQIINQQAISRNLNPFYVAGLIAQESGFDPSAISSGRALGLTQVTALGEAEVVRANNGWPRYAGIDQMPLPVLRMAILNGKINATNEWRLNPALSIKGGIEYLAYLSEYWSRPDKRALIEKNLGDSDLAFSEVLLASYNSGAKRVSAALVNRGPAYLEDEELGEARKYVKRVTSYCSYFAHKEE
ncbi:MAG: transglycosylase SLT domain-containing protein [Bdellovibrionales bacterium]|nr:transglycosylase SLT domain-containing protein [Bdellovibrionales bacterium]